MGAICCLEKAGLPLHQGSNQNDSRRVQTFSKLLKKEEVEQIKILEVQEGSFYKRKFKCALKRTACLYKNQHSTGFQRSKRRAQNSKRPIQKSKRKTQKSDKHLAFPDALAPVTRKLTFAKITGNLLKCQSQISKRRQSFSASSAPVTRKLSFAEITGNLSKRRSQISKRRQSFSALSTPVTCTLSLAEITDNLSKISDKEEST
ncbi:hypothetical protein ACFX1Q_016625 [Malus domestica]